MKYLSVNNHSVLLYHTFPHQKTADVYVHLGLNKMAQNSISYRESSTASPACRLDQDELLWEIEMGEAVTADFFMVLVFAMPDNYVLPGISGRRNIACISRRDG